MKIKQLLASLGFLTAVLSAPTVQATVYHVTTTGGWGTTTTFTPNGNPGASDDVIVDAGKTLTLGAVRACSTMTINGQLTCDNGITVSGATLINSGGTNLISSTTGTKTFTGDVTLSAGGFWNETAAATMTFGGNLAANGPFTASTGVHTFTGASKTFSGVMSIPSITINSPGSYQNNGSLVCSTALAGTGSFVNGAGAAITLPSAAPTIASFTVTGAANSTVVYTQNGATPQTGTYNNLVFNSSGGNCNLGSITTINGILSVYAPLAAITWPASLTLGKGINWGDSSTASTSASAITMGGPFTLGGGGTALLTLTGVLNDSGSGYSLTKIGNSSVTLAPATPETYGGYTAINGGGILTLDHANATTPGNGIINSVAGTRLAFGTNAAGGGALIMTGKASATCTQNFNSLTLTSGGNTVSNNVNSATSCALSLGPISRNPFGGTVDFGNSAAAGSITTIAAHNSAGILGGWATVLGSDWASTNGTGAIVALPAYTGALPTSGALSSGNYTMGANITLAATESINSLKITTANTLGLNGKNLTFAGDTGGLLATAAATVSGLGTIGAGANEFIVYVKSGVNMGFTINPGGGNATLIGATAGGLTKTGPGTLTLNCNSYTTPYTGPTVVHQGTLATLGISTISSSALQLDAGTTISFANTACAFNGSLSGSGKVGLDNTVLSLGANATIYPGGTNGVGILTFGNPPSFAGGANSKFVFDLSKDPYNTNANDMIAFTYTSATPTLPSSANFNLTINQLDGVLGIGTYTLMDATSGAGSGLGSSPTPNVTWTGGAPPASYFFSYTASNKKLLLTVVSACAPPTAYGVTGAGSFCNDVGATLGLANSEATATYQLFRGLAAVGSGEAGTGSSLSPGAWAGLTTPGTYTVWATNSCGSSAQMTGTATVNQPPGTGFSLTGGNGCSSPGVTIGLSGSESGVSYQLLKDASNVGSPVAGTGSAISFGLRTAAGVYTVQGTIAGCATATMAGSPASITIIATPNAPTGVSALAGDSQVQVSWTAPGSGPTPTGYNVKRSTTSGSGYTTLGAGANVGASPFTDTTAVNGTAYYYVVSALNDPCESTNSSLEAPATPNPAFSGFTIIGNATPQGGAPNQLTITAVDSTGTPVTGVSGDIAFTFSGLSAALDGSLSTVTDKNGTPRNLGAVTVLTLINGVASTGSGAAVLVAHKAESAMLDVTDGVHSSTSTGGAGLPLTISAGADNAYRISAATSTPVVGATNTLTIAIVDQYQNPSSFSGTKNITFGGLAAAPDGSLPMVDGTPFGTPTPITFSSPGSAALIAHKVENNKLLTATDGTLTAASAGGTAPTLSPTVGAAAQLGIITQPSATATAGAAFAQQPVIVVLDGFANVVSNSTASVTATASAGTLQGTTAVNANGTNGRATFSGLSLTNAGTVTLTFASTGLTSTNSSAITVSGGPAIALAWTTQPGGGLYGSLLGTQPVLRTVDQFGNPTTSGLFETMNVTVSVSSGGGVLQGTTAYNIGTGGSNGVISFTDLKTSTAGNKQLTASLQSGLGAPPSGMAIWLKADVASTIVTNASGIVTNWLDQSGNANNFGTTIGSGGNGIRYTNTVVPGRKAVTFNATSATTSTELMNSSYLNSSNVISVFILAKKTLSGTGDGGFQRPCASLSTNSGTHDYFTLGSFEIDYATDNKTPRFTRNNVSAGLGAGSFDPSTAYHIDEFIANASQDAFWLTTASGTTTGGTSAQVGNFSINRFAVGGGLDTGGVINNPFAGDVCELLVYTADMSSQRTAVETYLKSKWLSSTPILVTSATFTITPATVVPSVTVNDKPYDGGISATIATRGLSGIVGIDDVNLDTSGIALFGDKNVGLSKPVSITGLSLSGVTATNYLLSTTSTNATASISARTLTVTAIGIDRGYDGTTNATVTLADDRVLGDDLATAYATAAFEDSAAGTNKPVHVLGISITGGADFGNYALGNTSADTSANIAARALTVTATGINKTYDGTTNATVNLADDRIPGDNLTLGYTAAFEDKAIGTNKPVHVLAISISGGAQAGNYVLSNTTADAAADILARGLTVTATGVDKTYDGTTNATVNLGDNRAVGDDVTVAYATAGFEDKASGTNKPVHLFGISTTGGIDAGNYVLSNTNADSTANIASRPLTVTAAGINKFNDGTTNATVMLADDRISGDNLTVAYTTAGFEDSARGTNKPVHAFGISVTGGTDAPNYNLVNTNADTTANIMNNVPVAGTAQFSRQSGVALQIPIADLLTNATDADLDTLTLVGVSATTTNGTALSSDSTYVYVAANSVDDAFTYTVQDGWSGTNSGTVLVSALVSNPGHVDSLVLSNGTAIVTFSGAAGAAYTALRATNVLFSEGLRSWSTNAPAGGVFEIQDDFSDLGATPDQSYYRLHAP